MGWHIYQVTRKARDLIIKKQTVKKKVKENK